MGVIRLSSVNFIFSCTVHSIKMASCYCLGCDVSDTEINESIAPSIAAEFLA